MGAAYWPLACYYILSGQSFHSSLLTQRSLLQATITFALAGEVEKRKGEKLLQFSLLNVRSISSLYLPLVLATLTLHDFGYRPI